MNFLSLIAHAGIYALMLMATAGAVATVTLRNLFHAALSLAGTLIAIAGVYVALNAEFLAMAQILIYVGAVMTLIIFAIMLTEKITGGKARQHNRQSAPAFFVISIFVICLSWIFFKTPWPVNPALTAVKVSTQSLGETLMSVYVFPFEVIGVLLFAVLIGAIVIARKEEPS